MDELSSDEARRIALTAQGLRGARVKGGVAGMLRLLGGVQLDTISVLARSHELVAYARLGPVGRERVEKAFWGSGSSTFEYWSHAACVLPLEEWPAYAIKRRIRLAKGKRWHVLQERDKSCAEVVARLRGEGPLTANELGGAKKGGTWWDWSETKIAAEWLLDVGTLVCRQRRGFQRVYDLAERAIPADLLALDWSDEESAGRLVATAAAALGVATVADLAAYRGLTQRTVPRCARRCSVATGEGRGMAVRGVSRSQRPGRHFEREPEGGACSSHRSTRSSGSGTASNGCSGYATAWRRTPRPRNGSTATSPCPYSAGTGSSVSSTRRAATVHWWPSR